MLYVPAEAVDKYRNSPAFEVFRIIKPLKEKVTWQDQQTKVVTHHEKAPSEKVIIGGSQSDWTRKKYSAYSEGMAGGTKAEGSEKRQPPTPQNEERRQEQPQKEPRQHTWPMPPVPPAEEPEVVYEYDDSADGYYPDAGPHPLLLLLSLIPPVGFIMGFLMMRSRPRAGHAYVSCATIVAIIAAIIRCSY